MYNNLTYPAKWAAAIVRSHKPISKVEVWNGSQFVQELPNVTGGSVDVDETRAVRRTCKLTIASHGYPKDDLIPLGETDLLHPSSGNELRIFRGIDYQDGTLDYVPLGVFRMSKPQTQDNNGEITIAISGNDRSFWANLLKWQVPYVIPAGTDLSAAIRTAITFLYPGLTFNFVPTNPLPGTGVSYTVPATTFGLNISQSNTPWADLAKLAAVAGLELLFDVTGVCVLRPVIDPTTAPTVKAWIEGGNCTMTKLGRTADESVEYNGAICVGTGTGGPPVRGIAVITDLNSPIVWGGSWGEVPYIFENQQIPAPGQSNTDAIAQATLAAKAQLQLVSRALNTTTMEFTPDPTLQEGDGVSIVREKVYGSLTPVLAVLSTTTIPLAVKDTQQAACRPGVAA